MCRPATEPGLRIVNQQERCTTAALRVIAMAHRAYMLSKCGIHVWSCCSGPPDISSAGSEPESSGQGHSMLLGGDPDRVCVNVRYQCVARIRNGRSASSVVPVTSMLLCVPVRVDAILFSSSECGWVCGQVIMRTWVICRTR